MVMICSNLLNRPGTYLSLKNVTHHFEVKTKWHFRLWFENYYSFKNKFQFRNFTGAKYIVSFFLFEIIISSTKSVGLLFSLHLFFFHLCNITVNKLSTEFLLTFAILTKSESCINAIVNFLQRHIHFVGYSP